ncbi:MAG: amino acid ABC transporter permease [Lachnospiraceae bacterium]|nr:amino acid ABC transporter permease [Lachnospiraceae bacterium]
MDVLQKMLSWLPQLLDGARITILMTITATCAGVILGTFLALGKISRNVVISKLCSAYIFFFRGTPLLMQLYFLYYAVPMFLPALTINSRFLAAFIAYGLNSGAYCAELIRAAIQSIDPGQSEAARALGLTYGQTMRLLIIPQSIRRLVPPVGNEFIMMLKDVSLVSIISLGDLTKVTRSINSSAATPLVYIPSMIIYLIITAFFTFVFNRVESHMAKKE